jgi:hypothetical protein
MPRGIGGETWGKEREEGRPGIRRGLGREAWRVEAQGWGGLKRRGMERGSLEREVLVRGVALRRGSREGRPREGRPGEETPGEGRVLELELGERGDLRRRKIGGGKGEA